MLSQLVECWPYRARVIGTVACLGWLLTAPVATAQTSSKPSDSPGDDYRLQRGDEFTVKVFDRPELEDTVTIRPDGRVSLMLVDEIEAAGLTPMQLDEQITRAYRQYYRDPQVTVIVRSFVSHRVYVGGEVGQPGFVPLAGTVTALTAVLHAGGFRGTARTDSVILLRNDGNGQPVVRRLDVKEMLEKGEPDIELMPYDVLYVPMSRIAKVDKFVDQYMRQLIPITLTAGFTYLLGPNAVVVPR